MQLPKDHLGYRYAWLVLFAVMGTLALINAIQGSVLAEWLMGAGWLVMAVASLLVPMPLGSAKAAVRQSRNETDRGWTPTRNALLWLAGMLLISGLVLRFIEH